METLESYIEKKFGVDPVLFFRIFQKSPGAEGYLLGNIGEFLFKDYAENLGYEVLRIKEKPEGGDDAKSDDARGDFYIRKRGSNKDEWFVIENKGVKSNAEKRAGLTNKKSCFTLLKKHALTRDEHVKSIFTSGVRSYQIAKANWETGKKTSFPSFRWFVENPGPGIPDLTGIWESEQSLKSWLDNFDDELFTEDAYWDLKAPLRLLQTHMPSSRLDPETELKKTGPLVTEFNILCVDLFLRTGKHEFVFANSQNLNPQAASPNHLQQNYTIDILTAKDEFKRHNLLPPWFDDLDECIRLTNPVPRKIDYSQLDRR